MKLSTNDVTVESQGEFETTTFRTSENTQFHIFKMLTTYSDPISSVVREYTSNCFDAHRRANTDKPVIVSIVRNNGQYYIEFKDKGTGLTKQQVKEVFTVVGESDKRLDNNEIGGFGIGAKSGCGYLRGTSLNGFTVDTYVGGTHYNYLISEESTKVTMNMMYEGQVDRENGTTVRIPILEEDLDKFKTAIKEQLIYFDNIQYGGLLSNIDYTIVKGKNFITSSKRDKLSGYHKYNNKLHICIDQVAYPLDFKHFDFDGWLEYLPIALLFNIGDVDVTPKREQIEYNDKTINTIQNKINSLKDELIEMYKKCVENPNTLEDTLHNVVNKYSFTIPHTEVLVNINSYKIDYDPVFYLPDGGILEYDGYVFNSLKKTFFKVYGTYSTNSGKRKNLSTSKSYWIPESNNASQKKNRYIGKSSGYRGIELLNKRGLDKIKLKDTSYTAEDVYDKVMEMCDIEDYNSITVPDDFENSSSTSSTSSTSQRDDDEFPIKKLRNDGSWSRSTMKESNINNSHTFVYGARADDENLKLLSDLSLPRESKKRFHVLKIAKSRFSKFESLPHTYHIDEFLVEHNRYIRRYLTATEINKTRPNKISEGYSIERQLVYNLYRDTIDKHNALIDKYSSYMGKPYDSLYMEFRDPDKLREEWSYNDVVKALEKQAPLIKRIKVGYQSYTHWNEEMKNDLLNYLDHKNVVNPFLYIKKDN